MQNYKQFLCGFGPYTLLLLLLSSTACRNTEDPLDTGRTGTVFADFFVRYLSPEQQLRGQVSFWEGISGDIREPLEPGGIVSFENRKMAARRLAGNQIRYTETFYGEYEESLAFRFRNKDGRYLQYILKMSPVRDFFVKGVISKSEGATFVINGGVINKEESLVFMFINAQQEVTAVTVPGPNPDVEVTIPADQLQALQPGSGQLYLVKKQHRTESHPNLELTAAVEYYTEMRGVEVVE